MEEGLGTYQDRRLALRFLGLLYLAFGAANAVIAPAEMYVFYLFSAGGRLHFEGFGFGAFMFANIAAQIVGYTLLAALFIPLGYGHLRLRRWAVDLAGAALWCWVVLGLPLSAAAFFVYVTSKDPSLAAALVMLAALALFYLAAPWVMLRFYRGANVRRTLESHAEAPAGQAYPSGAALTLMLLCVFYAAATFVLVFFNGAFPLFGRLATGLEGILWIDGAMLALLALAWGASGARGWAWWGALAYFGLFTTSSILTLQRYPFGALLAEMRFAPVEMEAFLKVPFQDTRLTLFAALPLALTLGAVLVSVWAERKD